MPAWKNRERKVGARLQAVTGKWDKPWPPVTDTGRVGHLGPQQADIDIDLLTSLIGGEVKSSSSKAKNPGYRYNKDDLLKLIKGVKKVEEQFDTTLIPAFALAIAHTPTMVATTEQWFLRLLVFFIATVSDQFCEYGNLKSWEEGLEEAIEKADEMIEDLFDDRQLSKRYR